MTTNNTNINNNVKPVEMPFFVGYHMAENGIGKAMIVEYDEHTVTLALCGDSEVYEEPFVMNKEEFNRNQQYLRSVVDKVGLENIAS